MVWVVALFEVVTERTTVHGKLSRLGNEHLHVFVLRWELIAEVYGVGKLIPIGSPHQLR